MFQYHMRAYKTTSPTGFVSWTSLNSPDFDATFSGYNPNDLDFIIINKTTIIQDGNSVFDGYLAKKPNTGSFATSGFIRIGQSEDIITFRSLTNTNLKALSVASNQITIGENNIPVITINAQSIDFQRNGIHLATISGGLNDKFIAIDGGAEIGSLRVPNDTISLSARNADNDGDISIVTTDASNNTILGDANYPIFSIGTNIGFFSTNTNFANGTEIIFIANSNDTPGSNPVAGGYLYVDNGALKYRGSSGTVTTLGNA